MVASVSYVIGQEYQMHITLGEVNGGLGIEQNVVTLCIQCHSSYDNGFTREYSGKRIKEYLQSKYKDWNEKDLIYNKWKGFKFN